MKELQKHNDRLKQHPRWDYRRAYYDARAEGWAVDFQFGADETGPAIKIASIVDEHTRECLGGIVARSITGNELIVDLDAIATQRGLPQVLRCDDGPELICQAMVDWAGEVTGIYDIPPGAP